MTHRIRRETGADRDAIADVVTAAFGSDAEADLVEAIRQSSEYIPELSLVAEIDDTVVGHVMISHATIDGDAGMVGVGLLAPLAVAPGHQGAGIGGDLVRHVCRLADDRGEPLVLLEGSPDYYPRFGFERADEHGIVMPMPDWAPKAAGQVLRLRAYDASMRGTAVYPAAFSIVS